MVDKLTPEKRSVNMRAIRSKNMKPEMVVRRLVYRLGYRYRLHRKELPGRPDLVFGPRRKVIFVHGCFWHQHNDPNCKIVRVPKSNQSYWLPKLERNKANDKKHKTHLRKMGWKIFVVWECEIKNLEKLKLVLKNFLD